MLNYTNATSSFRECVKSPDVKTALVSLNNFFLEHHTVENSLLVDSVMLLIKESSEGAGVHFNSIGKPNRMFPWFVIDYLLMCILFDSFIDHRLLVAPIPYKNVPMSKENISMLVHNKQHHNQKKYFHQNNTLCQDMEYFEVEKHQWE
jgi:hypothetical protein